MPKKTRDAQRLDTDIQNSVPRYPSECALCMYVYGGSYCMNRIASIVDTGFFFLCARYFDESTHSAYNMKTYMYLDQLFFFQKYQTGQVQQLGRPTEVAEEATGKSGKTCAASRIDFAGFLLGIVYTDWP